MNGDGRPGRPILVEKFRPNFVETAKIVHVDKEDADLDDVAQRKAGVLEDLADVADHGTTLLLDIQLRDAHCVDFSSFEGTVLAARACAGHEHEIPGPPVVRKGTARYSEFADDSCLGRFYTGNSCRLALDGFYSHSATWNSAVPRFCTPRETLTPGRRASAEVAAPASTMSPGIRRSPARDTRREASANAR